MDLNLLRENENEHYRIIVIIFATGYQTLIRINYGK